MRRPLLIILIFIITIAYFTTSNPKLNNEYSNDIVSVKGIVKGQIEKDKYDEYKVDRFLVRDYSRMKKLEVGKIVEINGEFKSLDEMKYEDFDYGRYIKSTGCKGIIYIKSYKNIGENKIYTFLNQIKTNTRSTLRYLYKNNSDFINSILIGEKENLTQEEKKVFSKTGTSHIIAISGFHVGILCGVVAFIMKKINRFYKLIVLILIMMLYSLMVGSPPSIIRAVVFMIILYMAVFLDRKRDSLSTLSVIGIFLITNNPYIIYNVSFQLSFLATLSIIYFYGYINDKVKVSIISLTLSSNILTLPIVYYNFKGIPLISIIGNIVIVPFMAIIMYLSIISVISFSINIWIAKSIAYFNRIIINSIYFLLEKVSNIDFAYIEIDNPKKYYVIIYYIIVFSYMIYKELKVMKEQENELQGYYKEY
ncbi:MAG: ComEC/Rec2 family competence protein [Romboutsia sp.]